MEEKVKKSTVIKAKDSKERIQKWYNHFNKTTGKEQNIKESNISDDEKLLDIQK